MRKQLKHVKRMVIKVGTSTLVYPSGKINLDLIDHLAFVLSDLNNRGMEVILVSSGAMGVGMHKLGIASRPQTIPVQQAIAAIGQTELISIYKQRFAAYSQTIGQLLLTRDVISFPESRNNVINTLDQLLQMNVIPIINENDTVAVDELDHLTKFGDNDKLSAIVSQLIEADLLIMLSDIDGFFSANPNTDPEAKLFHHISEVNDGLFEIAGGNGSRFGTGGMQSKLKTAHLVLENNSKMVLANGKNPKIIFDILNGEETGTLFSRT